MVNLRLSFFLSFQLKLQYFKSSESDVSDNNHVLPENIVLMYSKIFLNSKFKFSRKCQNKSVCVRRFLRCIWEKNHQNVKCNGAATREFQQCGMCDQQRLGPACVYAQSDQSLC